MNTHAQGSDAPMPVLSPLWRRVLAGPSTSLGKWSLGLTIGVVVFGCTLIGVDLFFFGFAPFPGDWIWPAVLLLALAGGLAALIAVFLIRERSIIMALPLLVMLRFPSFFPQMLPLHFPPSAWIAGFALFSAGLLFGVAIRISLHGRKSEPAMPGTSANDHPRRRGDLLVDCTLAEAT